MLQLSAASQKIATEKINALPSGSWGVVRIPNDQRVVVFSICGADIQRYSYNEKNFHKNYNNGMAMMLKAHAAKPPVDLEARKKQLTQEWNRVDHSLDMPVEATDNTAIPAPPANE